MNVRGMKDKVIDNWNDHKEAYIAGATCLLVGAAVGGVVAFKSPYAKGLIVQGINYKSPSTNTISNIVTVFRARKGPLGNAIIRVSDGKQYRSQREASLDNGLSEATLRHHLRGETPTAGDEKFQILREAKWDK